MDLGSRPPKKHIPSAGNNGKKLWYYMNKPPEDSRKALVEELIALCEHIRKEALKNGLDQQEIDHIIAESFLDLNEEIDSEKVTTDSLSHQEKVEEFIKLSQEIRSLAKQQGLSQDAINTIMSQALLAIKYKKADEKDSFVEKLRRGEIPPDMFVPPDDSTGRGR